MRQMKRIKADPRKINERFFDVVPAKDENGNPLQQNPSLNKEGFWIKPARMFDVEHKEKNNNK